MKSEQTFRGILTQENPGIWHSNRAAAGMTGDAAMVKIVEKVIALEEEEGTAPEAAAPAKAAKAPAKSRGQEAAAPRNAKAKAAAPRNDRHRQAWHIGRAARAEKKR